MFNDFFSKVAGLSPDTLSSSLQPYRDGPDFFINTTSLAAVIQLPIKTHSIDKDYLERREDLNKGTVKNIWDVVKSENRPLPHKNRASAGQPPLPQTASACRGVLHCGHLGSVPMWQQGLRHAQRCRMLSEMPNETVHPHFKELLRLFLFI